MAGRRRRQVVKALQIDFLSGVDRPAQAGALAVMRKRDDAVMPEGVEVIWKNGTPGILTSESEGHTHIVWLYGNVGETTMQRIDGEESHHDHPWMLNADGSITIGANAGHDHTISSEAVMAALVQMQKRRGDGSPITKGDDEMPEQKTDDVKALEQRIEKAEERQGQLEIRANLSDGERAYLDGLTTDEDRVAFVKADSDKRAELIQKAARDAEGDNPVLYTCTDGTKIRKSDGDLMARMAKRADEADARAEKAEKLAKRERIEKRASEDLAGLPGDMDVKVAVVEALDDIEDETLRKGAFALLKAGGSRIGKALERQGSSAGSTGDGEGEGGGEQLEKMAKAYQKEHGDVSFEQAYAAVMQTPEGRAAAAAEQNLGDRNLQ